jgi:hypothetical protein
MAVPNRPAAGAPIESAWGSLAHDTAVAQDIQRGTATAPAGGASVTVAVVFPRAFASTPTVVASVSGSSGVFVAGTGGASATQVNVLVFRRDGANVATTVPVDWVAIGPRA